MAWLHTYELHALFTCYAMLHELSHTGSGVGKKYLHGRSDTRQACEQTRTGCDIPVSILELCTTDRDRRIQNRRLFVYVGRHHGYKLKKKNAGCCFILSVLSACCNRCAVVVLWSLVDLGLSQVNVLGGSPKVRAHMGYTKYVGKQLNTRTSVQMHPHAGRASPDIARCSVTAVAANDTSRPKLQESISTSTYCGIPPHD